MCGGRKEVWGTEQGRALFGRTLVKVSLFTTVRVISQSHDSVQFKGVVKK